MSQCGEPSVNLGAKCCNSVCVCFGGGNVDCMAECELDNIKFRIFESNFFQICCTIVLMTAFHWRRLTACLLLLFHANMAADVRPGLSIKPPELLEHHGLCYKTAFLQDKPNVWGHTSPVCNKLFIHFLGFLVKVSWCLFLLKSVRLSGMGIIKLLTGLRLLLNTAHQSVTLEGFLVLFDIFKRKKWIRLNTVLLLPDSALLLTFGSKIMRTFSLIVL